MDKTYLRKIADFISENQEIIQSFKDAIECLDNPESYICKYLDTYNGNPEMFITEAIENTIIIIEPNTKLDIGEDTTKLRRLDKVCEEPIRFRIKEVFDYDTYMDSNFFVEYNGKLYIDEVIEDGQIADAISDKTGYLVDTVHYHLWF